MSTETTTNTSNNPVTELENGMRLTLPLKGGEPQPTLEEAHAKLKEEGFIKDAPAPEKHPALPPNFDSVEEMVKAYKELRNLRKGQPVPDHLKPLLEDGETPAPEKKDDLTITQDDGEDGEDQTEGEDGEEGDDEFAHLDEELKPKAMAAKSVAEKAGLDFNDLNAKWATKGDLDASDYEAFEKAGYPKEVVKAFGDSITELRALKQEVGSQTEEKLYNEAITVFGGKDTYEKAAQWARKNWTPEQVALFNNGMKSGKSEMVRASAQMLVDAYKSKVTQKPSVLIEGAGKVGAAGGDVFNSRAEYLAAVNSKQYDSKTPEGRAYIAQVEAKLKRSTYWQPGGQ